VSKVKAVQPSVTIVGSSAFRKANRNRVALGVLLVSATGFSLQISLTRIFSLLFAYHYVFLIVSLAVLGLGLGAALAYALRQRGAIKDDLKTLTRALLCLAWLLPVTAFLLATLESSDVTAVAILLSLLPYLLIGFCNALLYSHYADSAATLYGADLVGAALGLGASLFALAFLGPFSLIMVAGLGVVVAALLVAPRAPSWPTLMSLGVLALVFVGNYLSDVVGYHPERVVTAPPDKTMIQVLQNKNLEPERLESRWGAFARVDVVKLKNDAQRYVFTDGGAGSFMQRLESNVHISRYNWLETEIPYLPFTLGGVDSTLVIGAGAGYDVFMAKYAGAKKITAVEINPTIVEVTRNYQDYNGNILDGEGVTTVITDGRNFVERTKETFDLVFLNNVYSQAAAPTNAALAENYTFTLEAFRAYWQRLNDDGRLAIIAHNGIEGVRLLVTALAMLEGEGMGPTEALQHTALVMSDPKRDPNVAPSVFVLSKTPWTPEASVAYAARVQTQGLIPLFIPHAYETPLGVLLNGSMTLDEYVTTNADYNLFPTTDAKPFFYHLNPGLPPTLQTLLVVGVGLVVLFFAGVALFARKTLQGHPKLLLYVSLIGLGYVLGEVALLKRLELLLGQPVLALVVTLGTLLVASGLGSFLSQRFTPDKLPGLMRWVAVTAGLYLFALWAGLPALVGVALPLGLAGRCAVAALVVLPLGLLLGVFFPSALRLAPATSIPLLWAANALLSAVAAVLATVVGMWLGFSVVLVVAAGLYLLVAAKGLEQKF
jgi:protein-L-isoaspartate O-methyltransferase